MVCLIFAISGKTMTSHLLDTPSIKTCFTNIHPLQFITIPPRLPMLGGLPTPLFIRPPTIREGRVDVDVNIDSPAKKCKSRVDDV